MKLAVRRQMLAVCASWEADRQALRAGVHVPDALAVKYPKLGQTWGELGHSDVSTTMTHTHVLKVAASGTASPLDALLV